MDPDCDLLLPPLGLLLLAVPTIAMPQDKFVGFRHLQDDPGHRPARPQDTNPHVAGIQALLEHRADANGPVDSVSSSVSPDVDKPAFGTFAQTGLQGQLFVFIE